MDKRTSLEQQYRIEVNIESQFATFERTGENKDGIFGLNSPIIMHSKKVGDAYIFAKHYSDGVGHYRITPSNRKIDGVFKSISGTVSQIVDGTCAQE